MLYDWSSDVCCFFFFKQKTAYELRISDWSSCALPISDDAAFAEAVAAAVEQQLATLPRSAIARESWQTHGAVITVARLDDAVALIDRIAPEHLELAVADPDALADKVRNAGAIFLGRYTPEAIGDYLAGPNHVQIGRAHV